MKKVHITGKMQSEVVDAPDPVAAQNFVVVKIHAAPMCTEYHAFEAGNVSQNLGHEAAGEVVEVAQPGRVQVGDRVVVMPQYPCGRCPLCLSGNYIHCENGVDPLAITGSKEGTATYAQYVLKQDWLLVPIDDDTSYDHASMACCGLGPSFGAMELMNVEAFDNVLITGMGPVGLGAVVNAAYRGALVIAVEAHPFRAELARDLGADEVINPEDENAVEQIMDLTDGLGADKCLDTSGSAAAKPLLMQCARRKGHVAFVGWNGQVDVSTIIAKGLTLHGAWHWNLAASHRIMQVIDEMPEKMELLITHTFPMSRAQEAFELQVTRDCGKVILYPWE